MKVLIKYNLMAVIVVSSALSLVMRAQPQTDDPLAHRASFAAINAPVSLALQRLARASNVPISVEAAPERPGTAKTITIQATNVTVKELLDLIVQKDERYAWNTEGPVVNVFPTQDRDLLLQTVVSTFDVKNVNRVEAISLLEELPEVKQVLSEQRLKDRTLKSLPGDGEFGLPRFSLKMERATVRSVLNGIMVESRSRSWVYFRFGTMNQFFSLLMR
jgi:hypothetical protein